MCAQGGSAGGGAKGWCLLLVVTAIGGRELWLRSWGGGVARKGPAWGDATDSSMEDHPHQVCVGCVLCLEGSGALSRGVSQTAEGPALGHEVDSLSKVVEDHPHQGACVWGPWECCLLVGLIASGDCGSQQHELASCRSSGGQGHCSWNPVAALPKPSRLACVCRHIPAYVLVCFMQLDVRLENTSWGPGPAIASEMLVPPLMELLKSHSPDTRRCATHALFGMQLAIFATWGVGHDVFG